MKYLKKYQTRSAYDADYYNGVLPFPHVALVEGEVVYAEQFESVTDERTPLYIEALEDVYVKFSTNPIQYSLDNSTWVDLPVGTATPTVTAGDKMYFRAEGLAPTSSAGIGTFSISGRCNLGGNIMSMYYGGNYIGETAIYKNYAFSRLFYGQASIINARRLVLPAAFAYGYCYSYMFYGCSSLEVAPELPARSLGSYCYQYMFYGCSGLKKAPALPATTASSYCYGYMFSGCSSLEVAPELPARSLSSSCYQYMFQGCSGLKKAPAILPATALQTMCYAYMFYGCSSLEVAPELPDASVSSSCCQNMFFNCTRLRYIKAMTLTAPNSASSSHGSWVSGVAGTGTFVKNAAATWENTFGPSAIPTGWDVVLAEE